MKLSVLNSHDDKEEIQRICEELSSQADISYFLTWGWIENWIDCLDNAGAELSFYVYSKDSRPICAFFIGNNKGRRRGIISYRNLYFNSTGTPEFDELCIEYNSMLYKTAEPIDLFEVISKIPVKWDEIVFPALSEDIMPGIAMSSNQFPDKFDSLKLIVDRIEPTPYVSLDQVRNKPGGFIPLLGKNTRYNIRKSYKMYEKEGPISAVLATDKESALQIYDELVHLHQKSWRARGYPGAFSSVFFYNFHKQLISKRYHTGEIQLMRIRCGETTIGCLYNFIHQGAVLQYQSGINFSISPEKKLHPGFVCYTECINYNADLNYYVFDFMAGSLEYKRRLSTNQKNIIYARIQKPKLKFLIEQKMESAYRWLKNRNFTFNSLTG